MMLSLDNVCHHNNVSFDRSRCLAARRLSDTAAAVLSLIVTRDIIRDSRDTPRISCPGLVCESDVNLVTDSDV